MIAPAGGPDPSRTFRYSRMSKARDLTVALATAAIPATILWTVFRNRVSDEIGGWHLLAAIPLLAIPAAWLIGHWRWGSWVRVDELAISTGREARGPVESVAWSEVSSVAMREGATALYAGDRWMTVTGDCDDLPGLRREILERAGPFVLTRFEADITAGGTVRFRGGEKKAKVAIGGLVAGAAAFFFLGAAVMVSLEMRGQDPKGALWGASLAAIAGTALLIAVSVHLRGSGWRFGGVGVAKDALTIKGWGELKRYSWDEVEGVGVDARGGLILRMRSGPPIRVPTFLGDFLFLESVLRARLNP